MPNENGNGKNNKAKWVAVVSTVVSFIVGLAVSSYLLGQRTGKVLELSDWKIETAPRIERMDAQGTVSFKIFHEEYLRKQERQDDYLKDLDRRIRELEQKNPN